MVFADLLFEHSRGFSKSRQIGMTNMGDVSVDVFTIPMVEFDCLGGQKQLHKMGPAATSKFSSLIFRYFGLFVKNRFSQKNNNFGHDLWQGRQVILWVIFTNICSYLLYSMRAHDNHLFFFTTSRRKKSYYYYAWKMCVQTRLLKKPVVQETTYTTLFLYVLLQLQSIFVSRNYTRNFGKGRKKRFYDYD